MALKVFDLQCQHGHLFEGWFGSHDDYDAQQARGLVSCPVCGSVQIAKRLSAPRLNVAHLHAPASQPAGVEKISAAQAVVMRQLRALLRHSENVGPRFAEEARRIHEGDADARAIRGTATREEHRALAEEGIEVMAVPDFLDDERLQ